MAHDIPEGEKEGCVPEFAIVGLSREESEKKNQINIIRKSESVLMASLTISARSCVSSQYGSLVMRR